MGLSPANGVLLEEVGIKKGFRVRKFGVPAIAVCHTGKQFRQILKLSKGRFQNNRAKLKCKYKGRVKTFHQLQNGIAKNLEATLSHQFTK